MSRLPAPSALLFALLWLTAPGAQAAGSGPNEVNQGGHSMSFTLTSDAYREHGEIPKRYTCDGADVSPPLQWSGLPAGTKSLALIIDDPDAPDPAAPRMIWVHWVLYDLPPDTGGLPEAVAPDELPRQTRQGTNNWNRTGYGGPCPPVGRHRYVHKLYALDTVLPDLNHPTAKALEQAMKGHVLAETRLVATYQR